MNNTTVLTGAAAVGGSLVIIGYQAFNVTLTQAEQGILTAGGAAIVAFVADIIRSKLGVKKNEA